MATNTVRLQSIFDGIGDTATAQAVIDARIDDVILLAEEKEVSDFFLPAIVTKATLSANQKRAWLLFKFDQAVDGWRRHARRMRKEAARAAEDALDT